MTLEQFLNAVGSSTELDFEDTMAVIAEHYEYVPTAFSNGEVENDAGQNEGSCKIFAFAQLNELSQQQTLACFGRFYKDVLNTPDGNDHGNIRAFMKHGWQGISFEQQALTTKTT